MPNVPALEMDDGTCITESLAICRYLESLYPEPNLFGRDAKEIAVIEMWTRRAELLVATPMMLSVRHSFPPLAVLEQQNPAVAEYNQASGTKALKLFDRRLAESEWIAGDRLTIADIVAFVGLDFARLIKYRPSAELANVCRWADAMRGRHAAQVAA